MNGLKIGQKVSEKTVKSCLEKGWVEPWFNNALKPNWLICKLTEVGKKIALSELVDTETVTNDQA